MSDAFADGDVQREPPRWEPPRALIDEGAELHRQLLDLGVEAKEKRHDLRRIWEKQGRVLKRFYDDGDLCRAVGCENGWHEYVNQFDVAEALGLEELEPSNRSQVAGLFMLLPYTDEDLFARGLYSKAKNALGHLQQHRRLIEAADTKERKESAVADFQETIQTLKDTPHRLVGRQFQSHRPPPCKSRSLGMGQGAELYESETDNPILRLERGNNIVPAVTRLVSCLTGGRWLQYYWDEDGVYWFDRSTGEGGMAARWARKMSDKEMRGVVAYIPYCKRRMS